MSIHAMDGVKKVRKGNKGHRTETLKSNDSQPMKKQATINLLSPTTERKYEGKFIAVTRGPHKRILAAADTYEGVVEALKAVADHALVAIVSVPKRHTLYSH